MELDTGAWKTIFVLKGPDPCQVPCELVASNRRVMNQTCAACGEALRCYEKAHRCGDRERMALPRLARLHRDLGERRRETDLNQGLLAHSKGKNKFGIIEVFFWPDIAPGKTDRVDEGYGTIPARNSCFVFP